MKRGLLRKFIMKVFLPACLFSIATYFLLGNTHPHMQLRMRLFFSAIWIGLPFLMLVLALVVGAYKSVFEVISHIKKSRSQ